MQTMTVNDILQNISFLPPEDQCFIVETLTNRIRDLRRSQIVLRAKEVEENYRLGNVVSGSVKDLMRAINDD